MSAAEVVVSRNRVRDVWSEVTVSLEEIDVEMAELLLSMNEDNYRDEIPSNQQKIDSDIAGNRFRPTPDCIAITKSGRLANGAHRIRGVVKTGKPIRQFVARNWPDAEIHAACYDRGSKRTAATDLAHKGVAKPTAQAAAGRILYKILMNTSTSGTFNNTLSDTALGQVILNSPSVVEAVASMSASKILPDSLTGAFYWLVQQDNPILAKEAMEVFTKTRDASVRHPFNTMREFALNYRKVSGGRLVRPNNDEILCALFACWEKLQAGEELKQVRPLKNLRIPNRSKAALERIFASVL
jgi:hypothetical protein